MPHVNVKLYAGRTEQDKARLAEALAKAVIDTLGSAEKSVSVSVEDVDAKDWPQQVYRPEILDRSDILYKKPGYNPFE